jgi:hypothetical protein
MNDFDQLATEGHARARAHEEAGSGGDAIEITRAWGEAVLETRHVRARARDGATISLGDEGGCDLLIPREALGATRAVVVTTEEDRVLVTPPPRSRTTVDGAPCDSPAFTMVRGQRVTLHLGAFTVTLRLVDAAPKVSMPLAASLRDTGLAGVGFSTVLHGSIIGILAFLMPTLNASADEGVSRDQLLNMRHLIDASAERERDAEAASGAANDARPDESSPTVGEKVQGATRTPGTAQAHERSRLHAAGDRPPSEVRASRADEVALARDFGIVTLLQASTLTDPDGQPSSWLAPRAGSDRDDRLGDLWSQDIGDALGNGLFEGQGSGDGPGRDNVGVLVGDVGGLRGALDHHGNGEPGGFGCPPGARCTGRVGGVHHVSLDVRMPRQIVTNGRLPAEVIQRIVRQNAGRFRACYASALRTNPSLEGRVGVEFVIGRSGAVDIAQDSGSDLPDAAVRKCVVRSFYDLSFPTPDNGTVTVRYPLTFTPAS